MTAVAWAYRDSRTMLRRNLVRMRRYPSLTVLLVGMPVVFLLLFVYVFGGALGVGVAGASGGRREYANYVTPGILLIAVAAAAQGSAITVATDMTEGIINRFRTMPIFRPSVLTGHVLATMIQSVFGLSMVIAVALAVGFRPHASLVEWFGVAGVLAMTTFALTWLCVALGLTSKTVEGASNLPMPLTFLPFLGSGFVPTESMPAPLQWFAEHQPFTPIMETLRGLLFGAAIGDSAVAAVVWCVAITVVCFQWSRSAYNRDPSP
jgi:ABC-2 type transport system permease protein